MCDEWKGWRERRVVTRYAPRGHRPRPNDSGIRKTSDSGELGVIHQKSSNYRYRFSSRLRASAVEFQLALAATLAASRNALPHLGFRAASAVERALTLVAELPYNPAGFPRKRAVRSPRNWADASAISAKRRTAARISSIGKDAKESCTQRPTWWRVRLARAGAIALVALRAAG